MQPRELEKIRRNLEQATRILEAVAQDLAKLQTPRVNPEDHLNTTQQAERMFGEEHRESQTVNGPAEPIIRHITLETI